MTYSVSAASKASSDASFASTTTLVTEATSLLFVVTCVIAASVFYDVSTPAITYAPSIIVVTAVYVYAAAVKIFAAIVALIKWLKFKIVWVIVDIAKVIDKAFWSIILVSVEESPTVADATMTISEESDKSVDNVKPTTKKTVKWAPTVDIKYIKSSKDMTKEEKLAMGYTTDFLTKYPLTKEEKLAMGYNADFLTKFPTNAPELMTPDAPRKSSRGPRLFIGLPTVLFADEVVEEEEDSTEASCESTTTVRWQPEGELVEIHYIESRREMSDAHKAELWYPLGFVGGDEDEDRDPIDDGVDGDDDDDDYDSIGTLSDLDLLDDDYDYDEDNFVLGSDVGGDENEEETSVPRSNVDVAEDDGESETNNLDLGDDEEESGGDDEDDGAELEDEEEEEEVAIPSNESEWFDALARLQFGDSFGSTMVVENGREIRRSRRNR